MKASELRIGNIVDVGKRVIVECIDCNGIGYKEDVTLFFDAVDEGKESILPVELDENWLVILGFDSFENERQKNGICFQYFGGDLYYSAGEGIKLSKKISYVHELQNIFYAISGNELIIKC